MLSLWLRIFHKTNYRYQPNDNVNYDVLRDVHIYCKHCMSKKIQKLKGRFGLPCLTTPLTTRLLSTHLTRRGGPPKEFRETFRGCCPPLLSFPLPPPEKQISKILLRAAAYFRPHRNDSREIHIYTYTRAVVVMRFARFVKLS